MISKLVLQGPWICGSLLTYMAKHRVGQNLTSARFVSLKSKLGESLAYFFRSLPRLEELHVPHHFVTITTSMRKTLLNPLSAARSGSSTLLRILWLGIGFRSLGLDELKRIGEFDKGKCVSKTQSNISHDCINLIFCVLLKEPLHQNWRCCTCKPFQGG